MDEPFLLLISETYNLKYFNISLDKNYEEIKKEIETLGFDSKSRFRLDGCIIKFNPNIYFQKPLNKKNLLKGIESLKVDLQEVLSCNKEDLMSIIKYGTNVETLVKSVLDYPKYRDLIEKQVISHYNTADELWTEIRQESKEELLRNNSNLDITKNQDKTVKELWEELDTHTQIQIAGISLSMKNIAPLILEITNTHEILTILMETTYWQLESLKDKLHKKSA